MSESSTQLRPLMRPFVFRPVLFAAVAAGFLAAASYFFWAPIYDLLGEFAWLIPGVCAAAPLLLLVERAVRFRKTNYAVEPERIVVRTGTIFGERTIELDLHNVTLVEWKSPFLLRVFYGAGHVTAQEAGSSSQDVRLAYIAQPARVYEQIAQNMRGRGFSMQRSARICTEEPGPVGAAVDLVGGAAAAIYGVVLLFASSTDLLPLLISNSEPSLWQLIAGNYGIFADTVFSREVLVRMRLGIFVLGGLASLGVAVWVVLAFIDLLRRTYTLHDDVIDYYDGFLSETRRFIPLENLSDTKLTRGLHKRVLGLSDLRVSSRGAGSEIVFRSMPRADAFASALEELLEDTEAPTATSRRPGGADDGAAGDRAGSPTEPRLPTRTLKPRPARAAATGIAKLVFVAPLILAGPIAVVLAGEAIELGSLTIASVSGLVVVAALGIAGLAVFGVAQRVIYAKVTEYSFDDRRACETFDFISRRQTKFSVDKITSMSVLRYPLDYLFGTSTVRLRSIGSTETIDFRHIAHDPEMIAALERALGLEQPADADADIEGLRLAYSTLDALKAKAPVFALLLSAWGLGFLVSAVAGGGAWLVAAGCAATLVPVAGYLLWRGLYHSRLRARLLPQHLEVSGGILRRFRHLSAYRHVKSIESLHYPASRQGRLSLATGGGFSIRVSHLADIDALHERVDERLAQYPPRGGRATLAEPADHASASHRPHAPTQVLRHALWCLIFVVGVVVLPVSGAWIYLWYRRTRYRIEGSRIVCDVALVYRWRTTILFDRIDHLETSRNLANKVFGNSDIEVYTVGSASTDLVLRSLERADQVIGHIRG